MIFLAASNATKKSEPLNINIDYIGQEKFSGEWYIISNIPYFAEKVELPLKQLTLVAAQVYFMTSLNQKTVRSTNPLIKSLAKQQV